MTDLLKQVIGTNVRAARERKAWTQEDLASKIGKTPESVSNIERSIHLPTLDTLIELAKVLELDMMEMIGVLQSGRSVSKERARQEAEIALIVRELSNTAVSIAAQQIAVLTQLK